MLKKLLLFGLSLLTNSYNLDQAQTSVYLSSAAYCGREKYDKMVLVGDAFGFVYKETLYDMKTDLQGYIGYLPSKKTIYVVLRGSSSVLNWLDDFELRLVKYKTWPDCDCYVHNGFYKSVQGVTNNTLSVVKLLKRKYPTYKVVLTGHSYGASTAELLGMELVKEGIKVEIYNYGKPRVGDAKYAGFVNTVIRDYWRFTHNRDIVPHVPPIMALGYLHSCREVFEDERGELQICSEVDCEDPSCSNQYSISETNVDDHSYYLGHRVDCENSVL